MRAGVRYQADVSPDIKEFLKTGENELKISFESVFRKDIPKYLDAPYRLQAWPNNDQSDIWLSLYARKAGYHYGWDWGPRLISPTMHHLSTQEMIHSGHIDKLFKIQNKI